MDLHRSLELLEHIGRGAVQQHLDEDQHAGAELERIESGLVAQDIALAREALYLASTAAGDSSTCSASLRLLMRPSCCSTFRMRRSMRSSSAWDVVMGRILFGLDR